MSTLHHQGSRLRDGRAAEARVRSSVPRIALILLSSPVWSCSLATNLDSLSARTAGPDAGTPGGVVDGGGVVLTGRPVWNPFDGRLPGLVSDGGGTGDGNAPVDGGDRDAPDRDAPDSAGDAATRDVPPADTDTITDVAPPAEREAGGTPLDAAGMGAADAAGEGGTGLPMCPPSPTRGATLQLLQVNTGNTTACGYSRAELQPFVAAVDAETFAASASCGGCLRIETPAAAVVALLTDLGPAKTAANATTVAVSRAAMSLLAPDGSTYVDQGVEWRFVPCSPPADGGMSFLVQPGSNASYAAVLIQNHRFRIYTVEYRIGAVYRPLTRTSYNYWVAPSGMGAGPFILRITDVFGHAVEQAGVPLAPGVLFRGQAQFPPCQEASD